MRRGFKAEAERTSSAFRKRLGVGDLKPLPLDKAAAALSAELRDADTLVDIERLREIERIQPGAFSACTFDFGERHVIVVNPLSTPARTTSDVAHEFSHLLLKHSVKEVQSIGELTFFGCNPDEEQEANWLAGCLLLPRPLVVRELKGGLTAGQIAELYEVSPQMANFRIRATGAHRQVHGR